MATRHWLMGCGIGCLLVLVIVGGIGTCTAIGIRRVVQRAERLDAAQDSLQARFGPAGQFTPAPDGTVAAERLAAFLAVRRDHLERGAPLESFLRTLDDPSDTVAKVRAGLKLVPALIEYLGDHHRILLEHDLGPGEYAYLYTTAYFDLLGRDPADGPDIDVSGRDEGDHGPVVRWQSDDDRDAGRVRSERAASLRRDLNALLRPVLANQLAALEAVRGHDPAWAEQLAAEIAALDQDPERLPWQDGLPAPLAASLAPYEDELAASYSPYLNAIEATVLGED